VVRHLDRPINTPDLKLESAVGISRIQAFTGRVTSRFTPERLLPVYSPRDFSLCRLFIKLDGLLLPSTGIDKGIIG
jgi:hypothetical protein